MLLLDALVRYSTVSLLILITILSLRDGKQQAISRYVALVAFSVASMLLSMTPAEFQLPAALQIIFHTLDSPSIVFIWWFGLAMFQEGFELGAKEWLVFVIYTGMMMYYRLAGFGMALTFPPGFDLIADILTLGMMLHLFYVIIVGHRDDLIEPRRRLRIYFVLSLIVGTVLTVTAENLFMENFNPEVILFRALVAFPLTVWALLWLTKFKLENLTFKQHSQIEIENEIDPRDQSLHQKLINLMVEQKIYLQRNLTIRLLSEHLETPEHRLRLLINRGLGYRNFNDFLNHYRIEAIKQSFLNPDNARTPILSIALEAGYNSLAPFNRAFLKSEGVTPTHFRQQNSTIAD